MSGEPKRGRAGLGLALAVLACGGKTVPVTPTLPDEPTGETAPDAGVAATNQPPSGLPDVPETPGDPWAGRSDLIKPPAARAPSAVALPKIERFTLKNGLKVVVVSSRDLPVVSVQLAISAGGQDEARDKRSLADFAAAMLLKGTASRSADQIAGEIDQVGGTLAAAADFENTHVTCSVLSKDLATCLSLLPDVVANPAFAEAEVKQMADQLEARLRQIRDDPEELAAEHFENLLWGEDHVRGWPATLDTVRAIGRDDLVAWQRARFVPGNAVLSVAGDVAVADVKAQLETAFSGWKKGKGKPPARKTYKAPALARTQVRLVDRPELKQVQIFLGHLGIAHGDKDFLPVVLMNHALGGGGFSSRLMKSVRSEGGKTYGIESSFERWRGRGTFEVHTFTRTAEAVPTLRLIVSELRKMAKDGPTAEELAAGQAHIAGGYPANFQSAGDVAAAVLSAELHGLGEEYVRSFPVRIAAVTLAQAKKAAASRLDPEKLAVVMLGNARELAPMLDELGLAYERVGYLEPVSKRDREALAASKLKPADPAKDKEGREWLDQALAAKGGEAKLRAVKDLRLVGDVDMNIGAQRLAGTIDRVTQPPARMRVEMKVAGTTILMVIDGKTVWQKVGPQAAEELPAEMAAEAREGLWRDRDMILLRHLDKGTFVESLGVKEVDGVGYQAVLLRAPGGGAETVVYIDRESKLVARLAYVEAGEVSFEHYRDYREVDGIQFAFSQHASGAGQEVNVAVREVKVNAGVPEKTFER